MLNHPEKEEAKTFEEFNVSLYPWARELRRECGKHDRHADMNRLGFSLFFFQNKKDDWNVSIFLSTASIFLYAILVLNMRMRFLLLFFPVQYRRIV